MRAAVIRVVGNNNTVRIGHHVIDIPHKAGGRSTYAKALVTEYVERVLGYRPRTALERLRVAEALERLPIIGDALADGAVSYSATREITRVATPETERDWLAAIAGKTLREVEALVAGHEPGDGPEDPGDPDLEPRVLRLELTPDAYAQFLAARRALEDDAGERLDDSAVMAALCRAATDGPDDAAAPRTRSRHQLAVTVCARCDRATGDAAGQVIDIAAAALDRARCDATHLAPAGETTADIPRAVRRAVERRDHGRCVVPGWRASRHLDLRHVKPRALGGQHMAGNIVLVCSSHHRSVHDGTLRVSGQAPDLRFEHADGRAHGTHVFDEARTALRTLGLAATTADRAIEQARAKVDAATPLPEVIRVCLRACPRPAG